MALDYTLNTIIKKIRAKIADEHEYDISEDEIANIIRCQAASISDAIRSKQDVKIDHIGKFTIKEGREMALETSRVADELGLEGDERKTFHDKAKAEFLKNKRNKEKTPVVVDGISIQSQREIVRPKTKDGYVV